MHAGYRITRWQHLSQKLLTSLDLPLACICFLEPPSKDPSPSPSPAADSFNLPQDTSETPKPTPLSQDRTEATSTVPAESAAVLTASVALLATDAASPLLGAGLAARSIVIARKHAMHGDPPAALWHAFDSFAANGAGSAPSSRNGGSMLEWSEELLQRCPVPCIDGARTSSMHGALPCSGQENSEPVQSARSESALHEVPAWTGKAKQRAVRGKAKKGMAFVSQNSAAFSVVFLPLTPVSTPLLRICFYL